MERRKHDEQPVDATRDKGTVDAGDRYARDDGRCSALLQKKVDLQLRIQRLHDEESVLLHEGSLKSRKEKAKEKEMYTRESNSEQSKKDHVGHKKGTANIGSGGVRTSGNTMSNAATDKNETEHERATSFGSKRFLPGFRSRGPSATGLDHGRRKDGNDGGGASTHSPRSLDSSPRSSAASSSPAEEGAEGFGVMNENFLRIIRLAQSRDIGGCERAEAERLARVEKMRATESRQLRSLRRLNLVEEMFAKALERRTRAMRKIAADPPADRLIGSHAVQHIPVALLPDQLRQTALAFMEGTLHDAKSPTNTTVTAAQSNNDASRKKFFLTALDATAAEEQAKGSSDVLGNENKPHEKEGDENDNNNNNNNNTSPRDVNYVDDGELLQRWREMGYTAVYLPASRRLVYLSENSDRNQTSRKPHASKDFLQLHMKPLPPVHLVQRKLHPDFIAKHSGTRSTGKRRQLPIICHSGKS